MSNKIRYKYKKTAHTTFSIMLSIYQKYIKNFDTNNIKTEQKFKQKYSYLLHWIRDFQIFKFIKN